MKIITSIIITIVFLNATILAESSNTNDMMAMKQVAGYMVAYKNEKGRFPVGANREIVEKLNLAAINNSFMKNHINSIGEFIDERKVPCIFLIDPRSDWCVIATLNKWNDGFDEIVTISPKNSIREIGCAGPKCAGPN